MHILAILLLVLLPVEGPVVRPFEPPPHPYGPGHRGVDIAAAPGTPVRAPLAGTIAFAGEVARVGWVTIDHGGGLRTTYGDVEPTVVAGQVVTAGQVVGHTAAPHLDWGARLHDGYLDPMALLGRWRPHLTRRSRVGQTRAGRLPCGLRPAEPSRAAGGPC